MDVIPKLNNSLIPEMDEMKMITYLDDLDTAHTERAMLAFAYLRAIALLKKHGWFIEGADAKGYRAVMGEAYDLNTWGVTRESEADHA